MTADEINAARTPRGGWSRETLASWGVPWPPPKGWHKKLMEEAKPMTEPTLRETCIAALLDLPPMRAGDTERDSAGLCVDTVLATISGREDADLPARYAALHAASNAYFHAATNRLATAAAPALRAALKVRP